MLEYKGYTAECIYSQKAGLFFCSTPRADATVTFWAETEDELMANFQDVVEEQLEFLAELAETQADSPDSG